MVGVAGDLFFQLGFIVIITAVAALFLRLLRQPQILAYVLVGIFITPVFKVVMDTSVIQSMSVIGIAFLLFLVGLEMDMKGLKNVALVSTIGGTIHTVILFVLGYLVALLLGFLSLEAAYVGLMLAFSSTMVVLKLLSDKRELNTLHGRIIIGVLLVEDIIAIFALSILTSVNGFTISWFGVAVLKFLSLFALAYFSSKFIFPYLFGFAAKHQELLLILSSAVCFLFSFGYYYLGFSIAIGAFVAGITLGNLEYNLEIIGKVKSLRDFFSLLFFVSLGMALSLTAIKKMWLPLIIILVMVIILKPLIMMIICSLFRYTKKPSFLTSNALAQTSEFSLIIASQGLVLGHISQDLFSLIVLVALVTIILTSYFVQYSSWSYKALAKPLRIFDNFTTEGLEYLPTEAQPKIVLCGHNRIGYSILRKLHKSKKDVLVVDYNPEMISRLVKEGHHCLYGDVTDDEIIERMNLKRIKILVSTVPGLNENLLLIKRAKAVNKTAKLIVTASDIEHALKLYEHGASYVIMPHFLGGEHGAQLISRLHRGKIDLHEEKEKHIEHLHERKREGHSHPKN